MMESTNNITKIEVLQEEVLYLRAQVALLQSQLASREEVDCGDKGVKMHSEAVSGDDVMVPPIDLNAPQRTHLYSKNKHDIPVAKMAERVRLRKTNDEVYITGNEIINTGVSY